MSTTSGSNFLAVVGGAALAVGMVGVHLAQSLMPQAHALTPQHPPYRHIAANPTQVPAAATTVPTFVRPTTVVTRTGTITKKDIPPTQVPSTPIVPVPATTQGTVTAGDQTTYTNQTPPFRITYPVDWSASTTSNSYNVVSADTNAGVGVYLESSDAVDLTSLQSALTARLPMFLADYGGAVTGTPQYQQASVDGIPAVVSSFPVAKNGLSGVASVSATYYNGAIYYVWGLIADKTATGASEEVTQVTTTMNSFHIL